MYRKLKLWLNIMCLLIFMLVEVSCNEHKSVSDIDSSDDFIVESDITDDEDFYIPDTNNVDVNDIDDEINSDDTSFYDDVSSDEDSSEPLKRKTKQWGSQRSDTGKSLALDSSGGVVVVGTTEGDLGGKENAGYRDIYITKLNSDLSIEWTDQLGSESNDDAYSVALDYNNNIYVVGSTYGSFKNTVNIGHWDIVLSKWYSNGLKAWTKQLGTEGFEEGLSVVVDSSGDVYITGQVETSFNEETYKRETDIFLKKLDTHGEIIWSTEWGEEYQDRGLSVTLDDSGNPYVLGRTEVVFEDATYRNHFDLTLTKLNSNGEIEWSRTWGTDEDEQGNSVALDSLGNIYVVGCTEGAFDECLNYGDYDSFITKFNNDGKLLWTKQWGTDYYDSLESVAIDSSDNIIALGRTYGGLDRNVNSGNGDVFLTKWLVDETKAWTKQWGSSSSEWSNEIKIDQFNNYYVIGSTEGGIDGFTNAGYGGDPFISIVPEDNNVIDYSELPDETYGDGDDFDYNWDDWSDCTEVFVDDISILSGYADYKGTVSCGDEEKADFFKIEFYRDDFSRPNSLNIGRYDLGKLENSNHMSCKKCVLIYEDMPSPGSNYKRTYFQSEGVMEITDVSIGALESKGSLKVKLIEVTIDYTTEKSIPVIDGKCYKLKASWDLL